VLAGSAREVASVSAIRVGPVTRVPSGPALEAARSTAPATTRGNVYAMSAGHRPTALAVRTLAFPSLSIWHYVPERQLDLRISQVPAIERVLSVSTKLCSRTSAPGRASATMAPASATSSTRARTAPFPFARTCALVMVAVTPPRAPAPALQTGKAVTARYQNAPFTTVLSVVDRSEVYAPRKLTATIWSPFALASRATR
jgi:hypothetical protein